MAFAYPEQCSSVETLYYKNYELTLQRNAPNCFTPETCTLEITGVTSTAASVKGASDGSLEATVSGATGSTITWYLDGAEQTSQTGLTATFTGLTAGFYNIRADEGECRDDYDDAQVLDGEFRTGDFTIVYAGDEAVVSAAENPIIYELRTAKTGVGAKATVELKVGSGTVSDGDYFKFELTAPSVYTQYFYARGFPNKSNYFLASVTTDDDGVNTGTNTRAEIAQSLADALQQDVLIPKVYDITYDNLYTIRLKAKQTGERFTVNSSNIKTNTTNFTVNSIIEGANAYDGQQVDDYSVYAEVFYNNNTLQYPNVGSESDYRRIAELELPFNRSNRHRFDIAPIMKNFVFSSRPNYNETGYTIQPDMLKPYFLRYGERYPIVANTNTKKKRYKAQSDYKWVINSSLNHYSINNMDTQGYLGEGYHDIKADFDGTITSSGTTDVTINVDDYLSDSGNTTGIEFRFVRDSSVTGDTGWQSGSSATFTGGTQFEGTIYISGTTSGVTVTYSKSWWAYPTDDEGEIEDYSDQPSVVTEVKFLTNQPDPKIIQRASQEYLAFVLQGGYNSTLDVRGDLYFYDGSSVTDETFFTIQDATGNTAGGVLLLNISYAKLGLAAYETGGTTNRKIKRADFAVYQTDTNGNEFRYTEQRSYRFEIEDRPRKYGIVFQNTLGGWDSWDAIGIVEETIDRETGTYTMPIRYNTDGSAGQGFKSKASYNTKVTNKVTVNSGWIDVNHFDWLKELLQSNEIYSYTTDNQNYMILDSFKYKKSSLDDLYEMEVTFIQTIYSNNITV